MIILVAVFGLLAVAGAVGVVWARTPVHGVLALILNVLSLAVLYLSLNAEFMAVIQLIIYAGAIMVLFLFVIALLTARKDPMERGNLGLGRQEWVGVGAGVALLAVLAVGVATLRSPAAATLPAGFGGVAAFGDELLLRHVLPFELTAFVLLAAVIGVVVLVGRKQA